MKEQALIRALKRKKPKAQELFFKQIYPKAKRLMFKFVKCEIEADSLAIKAIQRVYDKIGQFNGDSKLTSWVYIVCKNEALMFLRKQRTEPLVFIDPFSPIFNSIEGFETLEDPILRRKIFKTLNKLRRQNLLDNNIIYDLVLMKSNNNQDYADRIGVSVACYKSRLNRARTRFKGLLKAA